MIAPIKPQLAFDPSMAHTIDPDEPRVEYLARLLEVVPQDGTWAMEPKLDGWRWQSIVERGEPPVSKVVGGGVAVRSIGGRNGKEHQTPLRIENQLAKLPAGTVLDGELVAGKSSSDVGRTDLSGTERLILFDVLAFNGQDCTQHPWSERRKLLEGAIKSFAVEDPVVVVPTAQVDPRILNGWIDLGIEGAVCKRRDAPYRPGSRRRDGFVKIKPKQTTDAIVTGWKYGEGQSNADDCGALEVTLVDTDVPTTVGYDAQPTEAEALIGRTIEVQHFGWEPSGKVRHPGFVRLRPDMEAA